MPDTDEKKQMIVQALLVAQRFLKLKIAGHRVRLKDALIVVD